jgi:hypothetical protein
MVDRIYQKRLKREFLKIDGVQSLIKKRYRNKKKEIFNKEHKMMMLALSFNRIISH